MTFKSHEALEGLGRRLTPQVLFVWFYYVCLFFASEIRFQDRACVGCVARVGCAHLWGRQRSVRIKWCSFGWSGCSRMMLSGKPLPTTWLTSKLCSNAQVFVSSESCCHVSQSHSKLGSILSTLYYRVRCASSLLCTWVHNSYAHCYVHEEPWRLQAR